MQDSANRSDPHRLSAPTVILLHGLWMGPWLMEVMARRLRARGFIVKAFRYSSIVERFGANLRKLHRFALAQAQHSEQLHFVGHSLGGLLAARLLHDHHDKLPPGRLVALGTPLTQCATATRLRRFGLGTLALGFAEQALLDPGFKRWDCPRDFGVIAGRTPIGVSLLLGGLERPHDGTVAVSETRLDGLRDHIVIAASHSSLVFSAEAAELTARFLRKGHFALAPPIA